ncbi:MAG: alpha/beta fold hydrolase [bacterium]
MEFFRFNPPSDKPILHLAHANGFPPRTYRRFFQTFSNAYQGLALPARPFWPENDPRNMKHWSFMAEDLLNALRPLGQKVVGVGHSFGGVLTLYAALREPERFSRLILLDPTMLAPIELWKIGWARKFGIELRQDLVAGALRRRRHWESREAAVKGFRSKPLFKDWPSETLEDYVAGLTAPDPEGGVSLLYSPEWEARIYQTIPTDVWKAVAGLQVPTLVIRGERSTVFTPKSEEALRRTNPRVLVETLAGAGHLAPMEQPEATADLGLKFLQN